MNDRPLFHSRSGFRVHDKTQLTDEHIDLFGNPHRGAELSA